MNQSGGPDFFTEKDILNFTRFIEARVTPLDTRDQSLESWGYVQTTTVRSRPR